MQSDITESIEVSERSFNDKLAKLQIHCFQNVKFMDQLKHNKERLTGSSKRKLEQIIEQQYKEGKIPREPDFQAAAFNLLEVDDLNSPVRS